MDTSDSDPAFDTEGPFDEAETDLIWRLLSPELGMTVLDLACGDGRIADQLAARGAVVTGLDVTPRFLELAGSPQILKDNDRTAGQ
jgi:2-polyprenyl-3-methyl-5-hydroxy-6-metoxy-1,4-benzoquinol methylase